MGLTVKYYNLTGGLNTVQGIGTINQSNRRTESPDMKNVEYYKLGGICSMDGNTTFGNQLPSAITNGYEYLYRSNKYMIVTTQDGTVYRYDKTTNTFVSIYKFPTPTLRHSICSFNLGVVISNGVDDLVYYKFNRHDIQTGTVTLTTDSTNVVGEGTKFTTELGVGDYLEFSDIEGKFKVAEITDDTHLLLATPVTGEASTTKYLGWTKDGTTAYTTVDTGNNISVYNIVDDAATKIATGSIVDSKLIYDSTGTTTATSTRDKAWTQPPITSNTSYGEISFPGIGADAYKVTSPTSGGALQFSFTIRNARGSAELTWTFPEAIKLSRLNLNFWNAFANSSATRTLSVYSDNGTILATRSMPAGNSTQDIPLDVKTTSIRIVISIYAGAGREWINAAAIYGLTLQGTTEETYTYETQGTVTHTLDRDSSIDKEMIAPVEGVKYYLSDIAELNATYVNSDDPNISERIRGLALNSYQGRLFVGGNDGVLYYSEVGLIHGWDLKYDAGAIPAFYEDNSDFTALGVWDKYLVICKEERSYVLDGTSDDTAQWSIQPYSEYTCDSQQSWLVANNSFLVYSKNGGGIFPLLQRTIYNANYQGNDLSIKIKDSFDYINTSKLDFIFPVYHPKKKYIMFYIPLLTGNGSNTAFIFDLQTKTWLLREVPQEVSIAFRFDNEIYIGTYNGQVLKEFSGHTFDGKAINFYWRSPWFSFGQGSNYLSSREFRVNIAEESTNRFHIANRRDGLGDKKSRFVTNDLNQFTGLVWDTPADSESITDTIWDEDSWVKTKHIVKRFPLPDQYFQTMQIEFYGDAVDEGMSIYGFEFDGVEMEEVSWY